MAKLDQLYARLLAVGFIMLRHAAWSKRSDWLEAELELLHNVPSLIGETNVERHRYFWSGERPYYIEWASAPGREETRSLTMAYYQPIWDEMEPLIRELDCVAALN